MPSFFVKKMCECRKIKAKNGSFLKEKVNLTKNNSYT